MASISSNNNNNFGIRRPMVQLNEAKHNVIRIFSPDERLLVE